MLADDRDRLFIGPAGFSKLPCKADCRDIVIFVHSLFFRVGHVDQLFSKRRARRLGSAPPANNNRASLSVLGGSVTAV